MKQFFVGMKMRRLLLAASGAALVLGALAPMGEVEAGIANTKHNLGSGGSSGNNQLGSTTEICVFCHTPHGSNTSIAAPLWNKAAPTTAYSVYSTTNSSTIDGTLATDGPISGSPSVGSVSIACLSCHDGTQAMSNMINAPGSGGYNSAGATFAGTWTAGSGPTPVDTGTGKLVSTGIANLGTNLVNDHPIGIRYCGGGYTTASGSGTCADADFVAPQSTEIGGTRVFWVDNSAGTAGSRQKTDMILYNRTFAAGAGPSVECASCHDPHVEAGTGSSGATFLRISNASSAVCLTCHNK